MSFSKSLKVKSKEYQPTEEQQDVDQNEQPNDGYEDDSRSVTSTESMNDLMDKLSVADIERLVSRVRSQAVGKMVLIWGRIEKPSGMDDIQALSTLLANGYASESTVTDEYIGLVAHLLKERKEAEVKGGVTCISGHLGEVFVLSHGSSGTMTQNLNFGIEKLRDIAVARSPVERRGSLLGSLGQKVKDRASRKEIPVAKNKQDRVRSPTENRKMPIRHDNDD